MKDFPVLKIRSKGNSPFGIDNEFWLDDIKLENINKCTIQMSAGNINRAFLTMEVSLDIQVAVDVKDLSL